MNTSEKDPDSSEDSMLHKKTLDNPEVQREIGVFFLNINYYGYPLHRDLSTSSLFPAQNT